MSSSVSDIKLQQDSHEVRLRKENYQRLLDVETPEESEQEDEKDTDERYFIRVGKVYRKNGLCLMYLIAMHCYLMLCNIAFYQNIIIKLEKFSDLDPVLGYDAVRLWYLVDVAFLVLSILHLLLILTFRMTQILEFYAFDEAEIIGISADSWVFMMVASFIAWSCFSLC